MMNSLTSPTVLIRIAAVLTALLAIGHSMGYPWIVVDDATTQPAIQAMRNIHFEALGKSRSFEDFYLGFGIAISVMQFAAAGILWLIPSFGAAKPATTRIILLILAISFLAQAYLAWRYFFLPPLMFSSIIGILLPIAALRVRN